MTKKKNPQPGRAISAELDEAAKADLLTQAVEMLLTPSKGVKIKLLIIFNFIIGLPTLIFNITTLAQKGNFNNPERDWPMYGMLHAIMFSSGFYNLYYLIKGKPGNKILVKIFTWTTVIILMLVSLVSVQANTNIALSFLWDVSISIVLIFLTGVMMNRWAALVYGFASMANMYYAATRLGLDFQYILSAPAGFAMALPPKPIAQFVVLWVLIQSIAMLLIFFEGGVIGGMLRVIPTVIERIRTAGEEKRKLEMENLRMGAELGVAQKLQMMVLPRSEELKRCDKLDVAALMQPASEVGGDYYDVLTKGKVTYVGVGDVTDHGLASGVVMLMVQSAFRILLEDPEPSLKTALIQLNSLLYKNIQERLQDNRNMTLALLRHENGKFQICGQHEKILICRESTKKVEFIDTKDLGLYVGLVDDIALTLNQIEVHLSPGDQLLLYTDGATEAENPEGEYFGEERLAESLEKYQHLSVNETVQAIKQDILDFMTNTHLLDDITLVLFREK